MLDNTGHVKLIDFGLAKDGLAAGNFAQFVGFLFLYTYYNYSLSLTHLPSTLCGTPDFLAPEIITYTPYHVSGIGISVLQLIISASPPWIIGPSELFASYS